jgi:hypothetical protein
MWNSMDVISHNSLWILWTTPGVHGPGATSVGEILGTTVHNSPSLWMTGGVSVENEAA